MKKIYLDELEDVTNELINCSKNDIAKEIEELKLAPNNFNWNGLAYDTFMDGYNNHINKLIKMNNNLNDLGEYLKIVNEKYRDANYKIDRAYEELLNEFKRIGK